MHLCGLGDLAPRNRAWRAKRIACGITVLLSALACTSSSSVSEAACRAAASQCAQQRLSSAAASRSYAALRGKPSAPRMGSRCSMSRCEWVRKKVCMRVAGWAAGGRDVALCARVKEIAASVLDAATQYAPEVVAAFDRHSARLRVEERVVALQVAVGVDVDDVDAPALVQHRVE